MPPLDGLRQAVDPETLMGLRARQSRFPRDDWEQINPQNPVAVEDFLTRLRMQRDALAAEEARQRVEAGDPERQRVEGVSDLLTRAASAQRPEVGEAALAQGRQAARTFFDPAVSRMREEQQRLGLEQLRLGKPSLRVVNEYDPQRGVTRQRVVDLREEYFGGGEGLGERPPSASQERAGREMKFVQTYLPRLAGLSEEMHQLGGPPGVIAGTFKRLVSGPLATDEPAREYESVRRPLALMLASRLNGGRPTDVDREEAERLLPSLSDPPGLSRNKVQMLFQALADPSVEVVVDPVSGRRVRIRGNPGTPLSGMDERE